MFTAPGAGIYLFTWNSMTYSGNKCNLILFKNGVNLGLTAYCDARAATSDSGSSSMVLELIKGDRIWIQSIDPACGYLYGGQHISFSGCKIWCKHNILCASLLKLRERASMLKTHETKDWTYAVPNRGAIEHFGGVEVCFYFVILIFHWCRGFCHETNSDLFLFSLCR